jgi:hypothetical protein
MIFGSTKVDVLRSVDTEDGRGDPVESDTVALADLPVDIAEGTARRRDPADGHMVTVSGFNVAVRASCPFVFTSSDRLRDQRTGQVLQVETISYARGFAGRRRTLFCTESG